MLTPDSKSYQEIALRVAVNDLLSRFDPLDPITPRTFTSLALSIQALRVAWQDLTNAPFELRLPVSSFLSAWDFTTNSHPAVIPAQYLRGARSRLYIKFAPPDPALVSSQETTLRGAVADFLHAWDALQDTAAPVRKTHPQDFPHLPPLASSRLKAAWQQRQETSQAALRFKSADRTLHTAFSEMVFSPPHLRLALSHFLMTFDLLSNVGGVSTPLTHARRQLQHAFDPSSPASPSAYLAQTALVG